MRPSTIADAAHFTHGDGAGGVVRLAGAPAERIHVRRDLLTVGPCDVDPVRHLALRQAHWGIADGATAEIGDPGPAVAALPPATPIVLWATPAWSDQLWLWWTLDALARLGADASRLWLAQPRSERRPLASVGGVSPEAASAAFADAAPISDEQLHAGAALWRSYAAPSPLAFDETRRKGSLPFPELAATAEVHGWWFPRRVDGALRLAELDALVLATLADEWRTPIELLKSERGLELTERLFLPFGDLYFLRRLEDWAQHGGVEREERGAAEPEERGRDNPWRSVAYRITSAGRARRDEGLGSVGDAPALFIGGCRVNDPAAPFIRDVDSTGWSLTSRV